MSKDDFFFMNLVSVAYRDIHSEHNPSAPTKTID